MLNQLITTTKNFSEEITQNKSNWLRIDEILGDKASKFDFKIVKERVDECLPFKVYNEYMDVQEEMNKTLHEQNKEIAKDFTGIKTMTDFLLECTEKAKIDIAHMQDSQSN